MSQQHPIVQLLHDDPRYSLEAYQFVREALSYGQDVLRMGSQSAAGKSEDMLENPFLEEKAEPAKSPAEGEDQPQPERHLTGQQLCEAIREYAVQQYGYLAKVVLNSWGIHSTGDFGEIVYNLIRIGMMKKSKTDRRKDFDDVYNFDDGFHCDFKTLVPKT